MKADLVMGLMGEDEPLDVAFRVLTGEIWTSERLRQHQEAGNLDGYLHEGEHLASAFERELYEVYFDLYDRLEGAHPLKRRVGDLLEQEAYTLVIFDGLSLREVPILEAVFEEFGLKAEVRYALAPVPSDTSVFCQAHFGASGPSELQGMLTPFAFRHVKQESWEPDFGSQDRRRVIWALYPDNVFNLDSEAVNYEKHVAGPVAAILRNVLASGPPKPIVVTGDHGYLWQGGGCAWGVTNKEEEKLLADHFKAGRSTGRATPQLSRSRLAWVSGEDAAARGRFAWGSRVRGATRLFKHGGVTLMECMVSLCEVRV